MPTLVDTKGRFQVDRLLSNLRWLLLLGASLLLFFEAFARGQGTIEVAYLLPRLLLVVVAVLYNLAVIIVLARGPVSHLFPAITLVLDTVLIIGLVLTSGGMASLLLVFGLFPVLTAALRFHQPTSLLASLIVTAGLGGVLFSATPRSSWTGPNSLFALVLALAMAAVVGSVLNMRLRAVSERNRQQEIDAERRKLHAAREQSRLTSELASTLSATLKYDTVLDAVLEIAEKGLKELGRDDAVQVGAVLLFAGEELRMAEARHVAPQDWKARFPAERGALAEALDKAEPVVISEPGEDPELGRLESIGLCREAIVVPLRAGFESFGVVVFGSAQPGLYTKELENLFAAICNQAIVALQNARLYQDLREEKERIVAVEEDARKKLARSLHDGPTQSIASIAMRVNYVQSLLESDSDSQQIAEELRQVEVLARETTSQIRHMLFTLRPLILETQGLTAALEHYVRRLSEVSSTVVHLETDEGAEDALAREKQGIVFYIIEEAISNACKHSQANQVWVRLKRQDDETLIAEVEDNGAGFDVGEVEMGYDQRGSLGLITMRERAELAGGELAIASSPDQGTKVRLVIRPQGTF
ncbi:MAG: GAF domain-containing sensor histidine kinase [Anaerolineae bacterium]|jgi:signal transduction histidine kinase